LEVPIVGYTVSNEPVETVIRFAPQMPAGAGLDMIRATDGAGNINKDAALEFVDGCIYEPDRAAWKELIYGTEVLVTTSTILDVYVKVAEYYAGFPTKRRSRSRRGPSTTAKTSQAASSSPASKQPTSPSSNG
jgi:hypothetical protein